MEGTQSMKELYHFTSYQHMLEIIVAGKIIRTESNLLYPVNMRKVNGRIISDADGYKPVVWLTDSILPGRLGLDIPGVSPEYAKDRIRLTIDPALIDAVKWTVWADQNNMDAAWRAQLTRGQNFRSWYITEKEIPIAAVTHIYDRFKRIEIIGYQGQESGENNS